jgi:hypothetical protein
MNKFKKLFKSKKAMLVLSLCLGIIMLGTGIAGAAGAWSNTWTSPSVTITEKSQLIISSNLDGGGNLVRELGVEIPLTITIHNPSVFSYTSIQTHTSIYRTDGTIAVGDVELWHQTPSGVWQNLTSILTFDGTHLNLITDTADIGAGASDVTNLKVTFKTAGIYQASAYSCD